MKILKLLSVCMLVVLTAYTATFAQFNKNNDILIAQFDSKPDPDDIHSIAALGCILAHNDFNNIKYYAVAGAYGTQGGGYINAPNLFNWAFGAKNTNWTDAHNDRNASVTRIKNKAKAVLQAGGKVYVQEAGQSDITRDWCQALLNDGIASNTIKNNVIVVQHSQWNIDKTTPADLTWVKNNTKWTKIADGNSGGNGTPNYRSTNTSFLNQAKNSQNAKAKQLWVEADRVIQANGHLPSHSSITTGGVDFSDVVEDWWILGLGTSADNVSKFWNRFVTNSGSSGSSSGGSSSGGSSSGGSSSSSSGGNTLSAIHDAYLQGTTRYNNDVLRVESGNRVSYLMFDLSGISGNITSAQLQLKVSGDAGNGNIKVEKGNNTNWTESNLSNSNKPSSSGQLAALNQSYSLNQTYTWNLNTSSIQTGQKLSLIVTATSGNDVSFGSAESGSAPKLIVQTGGSSSSSSGGSSSGGSSSGGSSSGGSSSGGSSSGGTDLAAGKSSFQSSTYQNNTSRFGAEKVVDNNGGTFNHTNKQTGAWWEVDLGSNTNVSTVKIWNRGDCCGNRLKNFDIKLYSSRGGSQTKSVYVSGEPSANGSTYTINGTGRVVRVQLRGENFLHIDQLSVYGTPASSSSSSGGSSSSSSGCSGTTINVEAESFTNTGGTFNDGTVPLGANKNGNTINWVNNGDWMDYAVNVPKAGAYNVSYRISSPITGSNIKITAGGSSNTTTVPNNGQWDSYVNLNASGTINLNAGNQTIRLTAGAQTWTWNLDRFTLTCAGKAAVDAVELTELRIYPNPVNDELNVIVGSELQQGAMLMIYNSTGMLVESAPLSSNELQISTSQLLKGIYIMKLVNGTDITTKRFIKE